METHVKDMFLHSEAKYIFKKNHGFSLIGVIIAMIAVGTMAAMSLPALKGIIFQSKANNISVLANTLINAESTYVNNNNKFAAIDMLQTAGYLAKGIGINYVNANPSSDCIYGSIISKDDTKICLSVNNSLNNGTAEEISYALTITPTDNLEPSNYFDFYNEIRQNIPGSAIIGGNENGVRQSSIVYIDPIAVGSGQTNQYSQYVGKSFSITGAICYINENANINAGRGITYTRTWYSGTLSLYFIVEAVNGNTAVLSYANNPYSQCNYSSSTTNNSGDTYSYSSWVGGAFQSPYLPEVWGTVRYSYWEGGMDYVPVEPPGYEIEIPASYLPNLINLSQENTAD